MELTHVLFALTILTLSVSGRFEEVHICTQRKKQRTPSKAISGRSEL